MSLNTRVHPRARAMHGYPYLCCSSRACALHFAVAGTWNCQNRTCVRLHRCLGHVQHMLLGWLSVCVFAQSLLFLCEHACRSQDTPHTRTHKAELVVEGSSKADSSTLLPIIRHACGVHITAALAQACTGFCSDMPCHESRTIVTPCQVCGATIQHRAVPTLQGPPLS